MKMDDSGVPPFQETSIWLALVNIQKNYGKFHHAIISMGIFNSKLFVYQRVKHQRSRA